MPPRCSKTTWVFRHNGHAFSQYTPGWPLFMAPFSRLGLIDLAGPVVGGIMAVGVALACHAELASGLGAGSWKKSERIVAIAGFLGPLCSGAGSQHAAERSIPLFPHHGVCVRFA